MPFVTASDVAQEQARVRSIRDGLQDGIDASTTLDQTTREQWASFNAGVVAYLVQSPSTLNAAAQMDAGQQLERDLAGWRDRLAAAGVVVPPKPAPPPEPADWMASLKQLALLAVVLLAMREFSSRR